MYLDKKLTKTKIELTLKIRDINIVEGSVYKFNLLQQSNRDGYKKEYLYHLKPYGNNTGKLIKIDYNNSKLIFDCSTLYNSIFKTVEFSDIAEISKLS